MVGAKSVTEFAVFAVRPIVARIEASVKVIGARKHVTVLIKVGVHFVEAVIPLLAAIVGEPCVQSDTQVMSFIVKLFRVIRSQIAKNRPRVAVVFGLVGKKHRIGGHGVKVIVSLPLSAHHVVQVGVVVPDTVIVAIPIAIQGKNMIEIYLQAIVKDATSLTPAVIMIK